MWASKYEWVNSSLIYTKKYVSHQNSIPRRSKIDNTYHLSGDRL